MHIDIHPPLYVTSNTVIYGDMKDDLPFAQISF
jgi:hypothetical protein